MDDDKRRRVNIDEFLNFIAEKKSTGTTKKLGVRIQSLGMHIAFIKQARQSETSPVNKYLCAMKKKSSKKLRNHALLSVQKQQFDEHSSTMCKRIKSFSSAEEELSGKHIKFISGSGYENSDDDQDGSAAHSQSKFPDGNIKSSETPTTCPYPSASEEIMRLGLKTEVEVSPHTARGSDKKVKILGNPTEKEDMMGFRVPCLYTKKYPKEIWFRQGFSLAGRKRKINLIRCGIKVVMFQMIFHMVMIQLRSLLTLGRRHVGQTVWMRFSRGCFSTTRQGSVLKLQGCLHHIHFVGCFMLLFQVTSIERGPLGMLLLLLLLSIELGMWDSLYDKLHTIHQCGVTKGGSENRADSICVEVESAERDATNPSEKLLVRESDKYLQLSQPVFENLRCLQIVVVEKLFYRNVIRSVDMESEKKFECSCLLEGNILYATRESDFHSIFMEISRLFYSRAPDLHLANFLHMITTMAKSGSSEEQIEFFILNSQKMPQLPVGESVWSLANIPLSTDSVTWLMTSASKTIGETNTVNSKNKHGGSSNCSHRKADNGVHDSHASVMKIQAASSIQPRKEETIEEVIEETSTPAPTLTPITCVRNDPVAPVDYKTDHSFHGSRASANETQAPTEITCGHNHPSIRADWKTEHGFDGSCASVMKTQAVIYIQPRREETVEEVTEETSALTPTQITCVRTDPVPADGKTDHGFHGSHASFMKRRAASDIQPRKEETVEGAMAEPSAVAATENSRGRNDPAPSADGKTDYGFYRSTQAASGIQPRKDNNVEVIAETSVLASTEITHGRNGPASAATSLGSRDTDHLYNMPLSSTPNAASSFPYNVTIPQDLNYRSFDMRERGQPCIGMDYHQQALLTHRFSNHVPNVLVPSTVNATMNNVTAPQDLNYNSLDASGRVKLSFGTVDHQQALLTGRLGESAAFNYFLGKFGKPFVKRVNETNEMGLPTTFLLQVMSI